MESVAPGDGVLLVCHAGPGIGLGHLGRTRVVARTLVKDGMPPPEVLVIGALPASASDVGVAVVEVPLSQAARALAERVREGAVRVLACDLSAPHCDESIRQALREARSRGVKVVGIDGLRHWCDLLDLLWVPSFHLDAVTRDACDGKVMFGWDCYLVERRLPLRSWRPGRRILVSLGGSDTTGLGKWLPEAIDRELPHGCEVSWIRGPFADAPVVPSMPRCTWRIHTAPSQIDELVVDADFALSAFGVSTLELLQYGVPCVVFSPYGKKDREELAALAVEQVCLVADDAGEAVRTLVALMATPADAARMAARAATVMTGRGPAALGHKLRELAGA